MYTPQKFYEEILVSNPYLKVSEKKYFDEHWKESSFLITWHNRNKTVWTCVLPITKDKRIIYLKEFRYWPEDWIINFPIWMLDDWVEWSFWEKYPEIVKVYNMVWTDGTVYSRELCWWPHVKDSSQMWKFKIKKEESSSAWVRRIKAILEK